MTYFVYIIECLNGSFYVGHTHDLVQRLSSHRNGYGSKHIARYGFKELIYQEVHQDEISAVRREIQIKGWSRAKKTALARGNMDELKRLSRSREP